MDHPSREDLVAFSLGALEPGDRRRVEEHAPGCPSCTRELEALAPAVAVIGESVEQLEPPPKLRERVLSIVRGEAAAGAAPAPAPRRGRGGLRGFLLRPATALAALAVAAAGAAGYLVNDTGGGQDTTVAIEAPTGAGGSLVVGEDSSTLDLHGLAALPEGAVYQAWVDDGSSVRPSSSFAPDPAGNAKATVVEHLGSGTEVLVSRESGPGHTTPTTPILLSATVD